ncbi:MAG: peptide-methionine (S)-S-oxide reductase MsrA [Tepidisphaeraceae bacterium]|jgi:peptide-methionine (S)-S-oxide reductase
MRVLALLGILAISEVIWLMAVGPQTQPSPATQPATREMPMQTETATFAAGCFWGVQSTFEKIPGVLSTRVGYCGGTMPNPTYEDVCTDRTGHAESIEIVFDPQKLSYQTLLDIFFENHDPTTMNRQGPDAGTQYNSVIFYHSPQQKALAEAEKNRRNDSGQYVGPIVTRIVPAGPFYPAEEYHQFYNDKHGIIWSCHAGNGKRH